MINAETGADPRADARGAAMFRWDGARTFSLRRPGVGTLERWRRPAGIGLMQWANVLAHAAIQVWARRPGRTSRSLLLDLFELIRRGCTLAVR